MSFAPRIKVPSLEAVLFRRCHICGAWVDCRKKALVKIHEHPELTEELAPAEEQKKAA